MQLKNAKNPGVQPEGKSLRCADLFKAYVLGEYSVPIGTNRAMIFGHAD